MNNTIDNRLTFFLISTSHLEDKIWFKDEQDFIAGMNLVAVAAVVCEATVLNFILMSNHVHFVLQASREKATHFIDYYKLLYSKYFHERYGVLKLLRRNTTDFRPLEDTEAVCNAIAYVQMNCVAANICVHPTQYPWGCGGLFFNVHITDEGSLLGDLSLRAQHRLLHSKIHLPSDYRITAKGYINPASFVAFGFVESLFRTPQRFQYYLSKSTKAKNRLATDATPSFRDQVILSGVADLCCSLFRKTSFDELNEEEKAEMLKQLRYRFSADMAQLSRVTGIPYSEACHLIDSY